MKTEKLEGQAKDRVLAELKWMTKNKKLRPVEQKESADS